MDVKILAAEAALRKMLQGGHFDICCIKNVADMLEIIPDRETMNILKTLHCVDYNQMPAGLLAELPTLIHRVLNSPRFDTSRINILESEGQLKLVKG
ncbi:hypothetical protein ACKI1H_27280 [Pseudomonas sp. YH-1]|uniref:hypothetical protein n=1 Tax=Pseudomonas sp. YH-1 TaxID=3384787 RepID=UPI003F7F606D